MTEVVTRENSDIKWKYVLNKAKFYFEEFLLQGDIKYVRQTWAAKLENIQGMVKQLLFHTS